MNKIQIHTLLLTFTLGLSVTAASAETLQQAWETMISYDHSLKAISQTAAAAGLQLESAKAARLPNIVLGTRYSSLDNAPASKSSFGSFQVGEKSSLSYNATVSLPIYTSGKITQIIAANDALFQASKAQVSSTVLNLKLQLAESYIAVLRAVQALIVANSHVASLQAHELDVRNMFEQGMVPNNDLLAASVSLSNAQQEKIKVSNNLDIARSSFNRFLGRPLNQEVYIEELKPEQITISLIKLTEKAIQQRDELHSLQEQIKSLHHQSESIQAEIGPQVTLNGGYDYQENKFTAHEDQWSINLGMQWKIFDAGLIRNKAGSTTRQAMAVQEQYEDLTNRIALQVRQYWLDVQETNKRLPVTKKAIEQAEENLKVNRDRYENGLSTNTEVIDAENLRTLSQNNHVNAIYDAVLAVMRLNRATGEL
jgi:outer membrane protein TolC